MGIREFFASKARFPAKKLDERIAYKEQERQLRIEQAHALGRYSFFENGFVLEYFEKCVKDNDFDKYISLYSMVDGWDDVCNLSLEAGTYVGNLWMDDIDRIPAIHRTNLGGIEYQDGVPCNFALRRIMEQGLINNGHMMSGGNVGIPDPSLTTTSIASITGMVNLIASYKDNNAIIVLQFPRLFVNSELHFVSKNAVDEIYVMHDNIPYIKPEYIAGVIIKNEEGFDQFYSRDQILSYYMERTF